MQNLCIWLGQRLHRISTVALRMSHNQDTMKTQFDTVGTDGDASVAIPKGTECLVLRENGETVQVKLKLDKQEVKTWIPRKIEVDEQMEYSLQRVDVRILSVDVALERGATFMAEAIVLGTASAVVIMEYSRQTWNEEQKLAAKEREDLAHLEDARRRDVELRQQKELLESLEEKLKKIEATVPMSYEKHQELIKSLEEKLKKIEAMPITQ